MAAGGLAKVLDGVPLVDDGASRDVRYPLATRTQNQRVFRLDTKTTERWDGSAWVVDPTDYANIANAPGVDASFANNTITTTGLTYGYNAGTAVVAGILTRIAAGTLTLSNNATNYVERTYQGVVSKNTTGFTTSSIPMAKVVTVAGAITTITDFRTPASPVSPYPLLTGEAGVVDVRYEVGSVLRYGADPLGVTDATTAFRNAALAAAVSGYFEGPVGTFNISGTITLPSDVMVRGFGAGTQIVANVPNAPVFYATGKTKITVKGWTITGLCSQGILLDTCTKCTVRGNDISGCTSPQTTAAYAGGIFAYLCDDLLVADNHLSGNGYTTPVGLSSDIQINGSGLNTGTQRVRITGNKCLSTSVQINIAVYDVQHVSVTDNVCTGARALLNATTGIYDHGGYGIMTYKTTASSAGSMHENRIANNTIYAVEGSGIYVQAATRTTVIGNVIYDTGSVMDDTTLGVGGICFSDCADSSAVGNTILQSYKSGIIITGALAREGITVSANTIDVVTGVGINLRTALTRSAIVGNVIKSSGGGIDTTLGLIDCVISANVIQTTTGNRKGISLYDCTRTSVTNNIISGTGGTGIEMVDALGYNTVSQNTVLDGGVLATNTYTALNLASPRITVIGNSVGNSGAVGFAYGIVLSSACTNGICSVNRSEGCLTANYSISSAAAISQSANQDGTTPGSILFGATIQLSGAASSATQALLGSSSAVGAVGTRYSTAQVVLCTNAQQVATAGVYSDLWHQSSAGSASVLLYLDSVNGPQMYRAAAGKADGTFATFWGTAKNGWDPSGGYFANGVKMLGSAPSAAIADIATADATDLATAITLVNACKAKINADLAMERGQGFLTT